MFDQNDFLDAYGIDLNKALPDDDNPTSKVRRFIRRAEFFITQFFKQNSTVSLDGLSEDQLEQLKMACLEQGLYMLNNLELFSTAGYAAYTNTVVDLSTISLISPQAESILLNAGLLFRGAR